MKEIDSLSESVTRPSGHAMTGLSRLSCQERNQDLRSGRNCNPAKSHDHAWPFRHDSGL